MKNFDFECYIFVYFKWNVCITLFAGVCVCGWGRGGVGVKEVG